MHAWLSNRDFNKGRRHVADMKREASGMLDRSGVRGTTFKSRLCTRFMQKGDCSYGPTCHFAHGVDDLQNAERPGMGPPVSFSALFTKMLLLLPMPLERSYHTAIL